MNPLLARLQLDSIDLSVASIVLWVCGSLGGLAFLIWTYRGIFQRSESKLAWLLFAMRLSGVAALWLILAKPIWTGTHEQVDPGHVAIVVDNSLSMSLTDAAGNNRYEQLRQAVRALREKIEARGGPATVIDYFDINGAPIAELPAQPLAERTDLGYALGEVRNRLRGKQVNGIVLLSDGADNSGRTDFREAADAPVPVFAAGFAQTSQADQLDLIVRKPQAPARAMVNNEIAITVPISKSGGPATEATVSLKRGGEILATTSVNFAAGSGEHSAMIKFTPRQAGSFVLTVSAAASINEPILINNAAQFPLQVDGEPIRVLYLEGSMRWEFKYLKNRLEDDPDISLATLLRRVNPERTELRPQKELISPERLKVIDIIVLGDMEGRFLSNSEYDAVLKWLDQKNHSLLALGGYRSFGPDGWRDTPLAAALPVVFAEAEPYQREGPFVLQLTDEGKRHPAFALSTDRIKDGDTWQEQGRLDGLAIVQRAKPGATILAVHPELKVGNDPAVIACWQNFGAGKTMVLTVDSSWKWSREPRLIGRSDTLYSRFWSQTMRWLAGRQIDDQRPLLTLATDRTGGEPGKLVQIKATRHPRPDIDLANAEMQAEVKGPDEKLIPITLRNSTAAPDEFTGAFTPPSGGKFEIAARLTSEGKVIANQSAEILVQGSVLELADPRPNPKNLEDIARWSGGVYVDIAEAPTLVDKLPQKERRRVSTERTELWDSPFLFLFFLAAVSTEWFLRRRNHMV